MKLSQEPTDHILAKATCQSEWDNCDFAIIGCGAGWRELIERRMAVGRQLAAEKDLLSLKYSDYGADFYVSKEDELEELLSQIENDKEWAFVELEEGEEENFRTPESRLDCHAQFLYTDDTGYYVAYGKYTGEEYCTATLPFGKILESISKTN